MAARARPSRVALAGFACGRTRSSAAAARVSVVTAEALSELLLTELLGLMQANDELFRANYDTIHRVHSSSGYVTVPTSVPDHHDWGTD